MKKNLSKYVKLSSLALILSLTFGQTAFAFVRQEPGDRGMWILENNGRWWYQYGTGGYPTSTWIRDNGEWYYFESDGWMAASRWISGKDGWFYVDGSGKMRRNELIDGKWYVNDRGAWVDPSK